MPFEDEALKRIFNWFRETDLQELSYKTAGRGFSFSKNKPTAAVPSFVPNNHFIPVCASTVGLFHWNEPGQSAALEEGARVSKEQRVGLIETAKKRLESIMAPVDGKMARIMVEEGQAVEYGQPLFFIERDLGGGS